MWTKLAIELIKLVFDKVILPYVGAWQIENKMKRYRKNIEAKSMKLKNAVDKKAARDAFSDLP